MPATEEVPAIEKLMDGGDMILKQLKKAIVGQEEVIYQNACPSSQSKIQAHSVHARFNAC